MNSGAAGRSSPGPEDAHTSRAAGAEVVSHCGHALRTPLNAILGFAQILLLDRSHPLSAVQKERVDKIQAAGWQMLQLIDDLVELSRMEEGRVEMPLTAVAVGPVIRDSLAQVAAQAAERQIGLQPDADLDATARANPPRLQQVLVNLLAGALRCARSGGVVRIGARTGEQRVCIWIGDAGQTMTLEQLQQAFVPLAQGLTSGQGLQIGVALAQKLVERMGGSLRIDRGAVSGCEVQVVLPPG